MTPYLHFHQGQEVHYLTACPYEYGPGDPCPACDLEHRCGDGCPEAAA